MIWIICIVGVIVNWICVGVAASKEPNGAMGMAFIFPFTLIPFLLPIMFGISKAVDWFKS